MKEKIVLLNACSYENANGKGTRVGFIFGDQDKVQKTQKFVGYAEMAGYYEPDVFSRIEPDMIGQPVIGTFKNVQDIKNPLKTRQMLESFEYKGNVVNLL